MASRIVIEEPCEHANHPTCVNIGVCEGTRRRVLTEGDYVLIEKVDGEWPPEVVSRMRHHMVHWTAIKTLNELAEAGGEQP